MLIAREFKSSNVEDSMIVIEATRIPSGWQLSGVARGRVVEFIFDEGALQFSPDIAFLHLNSAGDPVLTWGSEIYGTRDGLAHANARANIGRLNVVAVFAIEPGGVSHCFINGVCSAAKGVSQKDRVEVGYEMALAVDVFCAHVPSVAKHIKSLLLKKKVIGRINTMDSIAALECQVDILTKIVGQLIDGMPADKRPELYGRLSKALLGATVDEIRSVEGMLEDIAETKKSIRAQQASYFEQRQAIEEGRA